MSVLSDISVKVTCLSDYDSRYAQLRVGITYDTEHSGGQISVLATNLPDLASPLLVCDPDHSVKQHLKLIQMTIGVLSGRYTRCFLYDLRRYVTLDLLQMWKHRNSIYVFIYDLQKQEMEMYLEDVLPDCVSTTEEITDTKTILIWYLLHSFHSKHLREKFLTILLYYHRIGSIIDNWRISDQSEQNPDPV